MVKSRVYQWDHLQRVCGLQGAYELPSDMNSASDCEFSVY